MKTTILSPCQRKLMDVLKPIVRLGTSGLRNSTRLPLRLSTLIAGPTGVGKSHFARTLAAECGVPFWEANVGSWIPVGAKHGNATAESLIRWIYENKNGLIFFDEICKISPNPNSGMTSEWMQIVRLELMDILEKRINTGWVRSDVNSLPPELATHMSIEDCRAIIKFAVEQKLGESFMIIGAGTWQNCWTGKPNTIGFLGNESGIQQLDRRSLTTSITEEILNRFRAEVHFLSPMKREDYLSVLDDLIECQPERLRERFSSIVMGFLPEALESGKGMRLFEEAQTKLCVDLLESCAGDEYVFRDIMGMG